MTTSIFMLNKEYFKYSVEQKMNGFHVSVHKRGKEVKIFSEQKKDLTISFPTLVKNIKNLSLYDFIIDGELVTFDNGNALGKSELMKYIGTIKSGKAPDDRNIKLFVWDAIYYQNSITQLPLKERISYLNKFKFNDRIIEIQRKLTSKDNLKSAIISTTKIKDSEGAVIKDLESNYQTGERPSWKKFKKLINLIVKVKKQIPKERKLFNYLVGVPTNKNYLNPKYISDGLLVLGHTFNTKQNFKSGDKIKILVEEIWRHEKKNGVNYSIHKPRVISKSAEPLSTIDKLDKEVVSRGLAVQHKLIQSQGDWFEVLSNELLAEEGKDEEGKEIDVKNFPDRMQDEFNKIKESGKWYPFVTQWHLRGEKSIHTDFRFQVNNHLEGITLFTPSSINKNDLLTENPKNIRGTIKVTHPTKWLKIQGRVERGVPGSTKEYPSYFAIVAKGKYQIEDVTDHKIIFRLKTELGKVRKMVPNPGEEYVIKFNKKLPDKLKQLEGLFSFHIANIEDRYISLFDKLKEK